STSRSPSSTGESRNGRVACSKPASRTRCAVPSSPSRPRLPGRSSASTRWPRCTATKRSRPWPRARAATRHTSASGCGVSRGSLWSRPTGHQRRTRLKSSRWHAHGNVYLVLEGAAAGVDLSGTDGAIEVLAEDGDDVTIGIVNPDGSRAEMSGNGTRIAAAWLMSRTGAGTARVHVGSRTVAVRRTEDGLYESELGRVEVGGVEV